MLLLDSTSLISGSAHVTFYFVVSELEGGLCQYVFLLICNRALRTWPQGFIVVQMRASDLLFGSNLNVYVHKSMKLGWKNSNDFEFLYAAQTYSGLTKLS